VKPRRQDSVDFDPVSAYIYQVVRTVRPSGVPGNTGTDTMLFRTRIKTPRGLFTNERTNLNTPDSRSDVVIEVWNYGPATNTTLGANLTADMYIMHRNIRYDIIGRNDMQGSYLRETTKYQCRICTNP
jgi:hypothetical protein